MSRSDNRMRQGVPASGTATRAPKLKSKRNPSGPSWVGSSAGGVKCGFGGGSGAAEDEPAAEARGATNDKGDFADLAPTPLPGSDPLVAGSAISEQFDKTTSLTRGYTTSSCCGRCRPQFSPTRLIGDRLCENSHSGLTNRSRCGLCLVVASKQRRAARWATQASKRREDDFAAPRFLSLSRGDAQRDSRNTTVSAAGRGRQTNFTNVPP